MLAPSAFLASAASTLPLQQVVLPPPFRDTSDEAIAASVVHSWELSPALLNQWIL